MSHYAKIYDADLPKIEKLLFIVEVLLTLKSAPNISLFEKLFKRPLIALVQGGTELENNRWSIEALELDDAASVVDINFDANGLVSELRLRLYVFEIRISKELFIERFSNLAYAREVEQSAPDSKGEVNECIRYKVGDMRMQIPDAAKRISVIETQWEA